MTPDQVATLARTRPSCTAHRALRFAVCSSAIPMMLALLWPIDASAQYGRTFRTTIKLTSSDIGIVRKIVREDLTGKPNGTTVAWSNPETQNSGTVTLLNRFNSEGRDCRRVRYLINPGPQQPPSVISASYVLTSCRLPDGTWKLDNHAQSDQPR
jgi:17 kDa outer membrane surface antigen